MMNTNDAVSEILKRKDALIAKNKARIKKIISVLSVLLVFFLAGGGALFIGLNEKDAPTPPPEKGMNVITSAQPDMSDESEYDVPTEDTATPETITDTETENTYPTDTETEIPATESEPVQTEPVEVEPIVTEPIPTEPVVTDPVVTEPIITEPVVTEPVATEPDTEIPVEVPSTEDTSERPSVNIPQGGVVDAPYGDADTPSSDGKEKYTESYWYKQYTYYFGDTDAFYDGVSPLPGKTQKFELNEDDLDYFPWNECFTDYIVKLYGYECDFEKFNGTYYETDDVYVEPVRDWMDGFEAPRRINYNKTNKTNNFIDLNLDIGAVDGYFDLSPNEAIDYVKNTKYYKAAVEHLGITDPYVVYEYSKLSSTYSYSFWIYDREDYLDTSKKTSVNGHLYVFFHFGDYEGEEHDRVSLEFAIYQPYNIYAVGETDTVPYAAAVEEILERYDYGDDLEYVKENLKCIPNFNSSSINEFAPVYSFYVEYTDENGNKYYKAIGDVSMFDESQASDEPYVDPDLEGGSDGSSVVRPTEGPQISDSNYDKLFTVTHYYSYESLMDAFYNYDQNGLYEIGESEKEYLYDTLRRTLVSDNEITNGIFGNFRKNILESGSIMIPYIDGKSVCGEYNNFTSVRIDPSYKSSRKPSLTFLTSHPTKKDVNDIMIDTVYMDPSIAKEAAIKGGAWATSVMLPEKRSIINNKEYYKIEGNYTVSVYEKEYTMADRKINALVIERAMEDYRFFEIYFAYDDVFVFMQLDGPITEEVLANFALYECDLTTGKPLRDTSGRSEAFWAEN